MSGKILLTSSPSDPSAVLEEVAKKAPHAFALATMTAGAALLGFELADQTLRPLEGMPFGLTAIQADHAHLGQLAQAVQAVNMTLVEIRPPKPDADPVLAASCVPGTYVVVPTDVVHLLRPACEAMWKLCLEDETPTNNTDDVIVLYGPAPPPGTGEVVDVFGAAAGDDDDGMF